MASIQMATDELHKAYRLLNQEFFGGNLPEVALTIQTQGKRLAYGWFTPAEIWTDKDQQIKLHEINISAEALDRDYMEIMRTLLHEMVHLYCHINEIQDTSRNGTFHNKRFKMASEMHGFEYDGVADKKYGWSFSKLTAKSVEKISSLGISPDSFVIARRSGGAGGEGSEDGEEKKSNSFKWVCPSCEAKVRSTKEKVSLVCGECSDFDENEIVRFELEA